MKHKITPIATSFACLLMTLTAGAQHPGHVISQEQCLTQIQYEEDVKKDPSIAIARQQLEEELQRYVASLPKEKNQSAPKIIPVVFHVIHEDGAENISRSQIVDQVRIMNEDFRRKNPDTTATPSAFKSIAADVNVEFRLATKDPNGNCTDGVTRTFSHLTNNARNNVKSLIIWPRNQYLNIWIVKTIENTSGSGGIILGFAQFPGGNSTTDGIVMRADYTGSIGTAASSGYKGRTATHEVGHWLNLCHIWDCSSATCGTDNVSDTPQARASNSGCPSFPHDANTCTGTGSNGEMYVNYMDYTNGSCQNAFSAGQSTRMNSALNSSTSGRNNLWTSTNLTATGTTDTNSVTCIPKAYFTSNMEYVCEGTTVTFSDKSWNGTPTSWNWTFNGGTPSTSTAQNPAVTYNTPGTYDVSLTVSNSAGNSTPYTRTGKIKVYSTTAMKVAPFYESFEGTFPNSDWTIVSDDGGSAWAKTTTAAVTGSASFKLNNFSGNTVNLKDYLYSPTIDVSTILKDSLKFTFRVAYAQKTSTDADVLKVHISTNCGQTWSQRYSKSGATLSTAPATTSAFTPTASQWRLETVNLLPYGGMKNVRIRFEFQSDGGNNIYLEDINVFGAPTSIDEISGPVNYFNVQPNPAGKNSVISFNVLNHEHVTIKAYDVMGREVKIILDEERSAGIHDISLDNLGAPGMYFIKLTAGNATLSRKIIFNPLIH